MLFNAIYPNTFISPCDTNHKSMLGDYCFGWGRKCRKVSQGRDRCSPEAEAGSGQITWGRVGKGRH